MLAVRAFGLLILVGVLANLAYPQTGMPGDKTEKPAVAKLEPKKVELHKVPNEELLRQAQLVLDRAGASYLAQLRELATVELAYDSARKQTDALPAPKVEPEAMKGDPLDLAKTALERARGRLDLARKRLDHIQIEKTLVERGAAVVEACASAALAFANLLDDLNAFVVEINLRVKDRTLPADAVPKSLEAEALARRKQDLTTEQEQWKQKTTSAHKQIEAAGKRLADAKKVVLDAEASFEQATRKFASEQKHKAVEKEYTGRSGKDLQMELVQLQEEEAGLTGAFNLALRGFKAREIVAVQRKRELDSLKLPESAATTRTEDAESALTATLLLQKHYAKRVEVLDALRTGLQGLIDAGGTVTGESAVLGEHLFKLQLVADALKKVAGKEGLQVPPRFAGDALAGTVKTLGDLTSAVSSATEKARTDLLDLSQKSKDARAAADEAGKRLEDLQASRDAGKRVLEFEKALRTKTAAQVAADFTTTAKLLDEKSQALEKEREAFDKARTLVAEVRKQREALKDPYRRLAEAETQAEKQKSLDELKKYAGLDRAPREGSGMAGMMNAPGMESPPPGMSMPGEPKTEADKQKTREKEADKVEPFGVQGFQQLLATRVRIIEEQEEKDGQLLQLLAEVEKVGETFSRALGEVRQLTLQQFAAAIDLKKRVGRGELSGEDTPEGIAQALRRDEQTKLDTTATALVIVQAETRQEQERIRRADKTLVATNQVLKEALGMASQRLDLLGDLKRLEADYKREKKDLTESDIKHLEQAAHERLAKDDTWLDVLVSLDTSPASKSLIEVLQTYYREVVALEDRQELLKQRKEKADKLVELAREETALLQKVLPLLREQILSLERLREEQTLLTRARLKPEEADELLRAYQAKTGKQLPRPVPIPEKDRAAAVPEANTALFERLLDIETTRRWERLIEGRLSPVGLPAEVGAYQDQIGALAASYGSNNRRLQTLGGKVANDPAFGGNAAPPPRSNDSEIGATRRELFQVRRTGVAWIAIQIALVLVSAWILPPILTWLLRRATSTNDRGTAQVHAKLVMTFMQAFLKLIVYTMALVLVLSILGFDITAILAGLGIGGLAIGLAAQHAISDMLGGIIIFLERPFSIGDTVKIGESEPAQVIGLTWRITQLCDPDGIAINIPNRQVTETSIVNLTRDGHRTYDSVAIPVPATYPVDEVIRWIEDALAACQVPIREGRGVDVEEITVAWNGVHYIRYQPFYFVSELSQRDDARCEVITRVSQVLADKGVLVQPGTMKV